MEYCLFCDTRLSGFEHDICIDCQYHAEQNDLDIEKEIEDEKKRRNQNG